MGSMAWKGGPADNNIYWATLDNDLDVTNLVLQL
jgi:hypothetical protein